MNFRFHKRTNLKGRTKTDGKSDIWRPPMAVMDMSGHAHSCVLHTAHICTHTSAQGVVPMLDKMHLEVDKENMTV